MKTTRTFVAVAVPDPVAAKLSRLQQRLAADVSGVRWTQSMPFHVTLAFVGDVEETRLIDVCRAVGRAASAIPPFSARIEGLGAFPRPAQPRTLWLGVGGDDARVLEALHVAVARELSSLGYPPEERPFQPHITIGRLQRGGRPGTDLTPVVDHFRTWSPGSFRVTEVVTFASTLDPDGPVYTPMARARLASPRSGRGT